MLIFPIALGTGVALGYLRGGRLRHLSRLNLRAPALVAAALALQLGAGRSPDRWRFTVILCSYAVVAAWLVVNAAGRPAPLRVAAGLLAAGWVLNLAAIATNGGMPVSLHAARQVGASPGLDVSEGHLYKHVPAGRDTTLSWLGDVIPIRPLGSVVSAGDVVMFAGIVLVVAAAMVPARGEGPPTTIGAPGPAPEGRAGEAVA
ncbi:MAG: DUF5317 domain-containing protein [Actinomycetota bacterium]|nr:DUF5317 domain-containing protein [Actinomycetota bacterium]